MLVPLLHIVFDFLTLLMMLRVLLQITHAPFTHPFCQSIVSMTQFMLDPLQKILPVISGINTAALVLGLLLQLLLNLLILWIQPVPIWTAGGQIALPLLGMASIGCLKTLLTLFTYALFLKSLLDWISPYSIMMPILHALSQPLLRPLQRWLPPGWRLFIPWIAIFLIQAASLLLLTPLEQALLRHF